jgi:hypothetical protein
MQFFVLSQEPRAGREAWGADVLKADGTNYGDAPRCEACGEYVGLRLWLPPYQVELETWGHEFPDLAVTGADLVVSLCFKQAWERSHLTGLSGFDPVSVTKLKRHRKEIGDAPPYFRATVPRSKTAIDLTASEFVWSNGPACSECRLGRVLKRWKRTVIDRSTWTGEDIFIARGLPGEIILSESFRTFCKQYGIKTGLMPRAESYGHNFYPWEPAEEVTPDSL